MDEAEIGRRLRRALARHQAGDLATAEAGYGSVLALDPEQADALHLLGVLADQAGRPAEAVALIQRAIRRNPNEAAFHSNLGNAHLALGERDAAEAAYRAALALDVKQAEAQYNLANILRERGQVREAEAAFRAALAAQPQYRDALHNLAMLYWEEYDSPEADALFGQALALAPRDQALRMHYGLYCLGRERYEPGWSLYESRWTSGVYPERDWGEGKLLWRGEALAGRHLLLWGEQGIGDQILYGTMLREAIALAGPGRVTVAVTDRLVPLFSRALSDLDVAVTIREGAAAAADLHCPFGSLGGLLRKSPADFMGHDGAYLRADTAQRDELRRRYEALGAAGNRVLGLSWRSANPKLASSKSLDLAMLAPLFALPGITWVSVQYGDASGEIAASGLPLHVDGNIDSLKDLDGYAAQLSALDGIVSVSNSAVHMAGALGVPCELLLARGRGRLWYWPRPEEAGSDRSRWYASLRLWHQTKQGKWLEVIAALAERLRHG
jgi:tetratricopeptide (TPR) repeat protein